MTALSELRLKLDSEIQDVDFSFEGEKAYIMPLGSRRYDAWYGNKENEVKKRYMSLEDLMTDRFYHGKSLEEIASKIEPKYY